MISEGQLVTWANLGATTTPKLTHERIRSALSSLSVQPQIHLQGSYKNSTNIYGSSDVDVVTVLKTIFFEDYSRLSSAEKDYVVKKKAYISASYSWLDFKRDVVSSLNGYFGSRYIDTSGKKSVKLKNYPGLFEADIVVSLKHVLYTNIDSRGNINEIHGIRFFIPSESRWVINYPKQHYENGCAKNTQTNQNFKRVVRLFKNVRNKLVSDGKINKSETSSYFIECYLYNIPDQCYLKNSYTEICDAIFHWLLFTHKDIEEIIRNSELMYCQNGVTLLFGDASEQWNAIDAIKFFLAAYKLIRK